MVVGVARTSTVLAPACGHAVEVGVEGDVESMSLERRTTGSVERLGGQRSQSGAFDRCEHTGTRSFALPEWSLVQPLEQFANSHCSDPPTEKTSGGVGGNDPAFDNLHATSTLGLVFRMTGRAGMTPT